MSMVNISKFRVNNCSNLVDDLSKVARRTMFTTRNLANKVVNMNLIRPNLGVNVQQRSAVYTAYKYKSPVAKKFATDGSGNHTMQNKTVCTETNCENKSCEKPCNEILCSNTLGHFTHKPPINSQNEHLSAYDIDGNQKDQYFVKPQNKPTMTADDLKNMTENDMLINTKATDYCNITQDIFDKVTK